jgi:hypothetical protein
MDAKERTREGEEANRRARERRWCLCVMVVAVNLEIPVCQGACFGRMRMECRGEVEGEGVVVGF